jgi:lipoyl(octanoyl) transferase
LFNAVCESIFEDHKKIKQKLLPPSIYHINLGQTDFKEIWDIQKKILNFKKKNKYPDILLTTEHNNVYTLGKSGDKDHLLLNDEELKDKQISFYEIDRGGDLTYHGPGQLVCYPVFDLHNYYLDTHRYLRDLEEVIILTLKEYGIDSGRDEQYTGVWIGDKKICAIGIKISGWITMHGLAFNINNNLNYFDNIIPCGIFHKGVTSLANVLNEPVDMNTVSEKVVNNFGKVFNTDKIKSLNIIKLLKEINSAPVSY